VYWLPSSVAAAAVPSVHPEKGCRLRESHLGVKSRLLRCLERVKALLPVRPERVKSCARLLLLLLRKLLLLRLILLLLLKLLLRLRRRKSRLLLRCWVDVAEPISS
jgi:hypothetical protein